MLGDRFFGHFCSRGKGSSRRMQIATRSSQIGCSKNRPLGIGRVTIEASSRLSNIIYSNLTVQPLSELSVPHCLPIGEADCSSIAVLGCRRPLTLISKPSVNDLRSEVRGGHLAKGILEFADPSFERADQADLHDEHVLDQSQ